MPQLRSGLSRTGPKPSCLCGDCAKCRRRRNARRRYYGLPSLPNKQRPPTLSPRQVRAALSVRSSGGSWPEVGRAVGMSATGARAALLRQSPDAPNLTGWQPSCRCSRCPTCASRLREQARRTGDLALARAWGRFGVHLRRTGQATSDLTPEVDLTMRAAAGLCPLCDQRLCDQPHRPNSKEIDHIVPVCEGGEHSQRNCRIICRTCNNLRRKGAKTTRAAAA